MTRATLLLILSLAFVVCFVDGKRPSRAKKEQAAAAPVSETAELMSWFKAQGAKAKKVEIVRSKENPTGFTLAASDKIKKGERLLEVPAGVALSCDPEAKNFLPAELTTAQDQWCTALRLFKEVMQSQDSPYAPYLTTLPKDMSFLPWYWPKEEVEEIQELSATETVKALSNDLYRLYEAIIASSVKEGAKREDLKHHLQLLKLVASWVLSRGFPFGVFPVLDFARQNSTGLNLQYDEETQVAYIEAPYKIQPGDEITINLGQRSGPQQLVLYGTVPPLEEDASMLTLGTDPFEGAEEGTDRYIQSQIFELQKLGREDQRGIRVGSFLFSLNDSIPNDMLQWARAANYRHEQDCTGTPEYCKTWIPSNLTNPLSTSNEIRALKQLQSEIGRLQRPVLAKTSIKQDTDLLLKTDLNPRKRLAIRCRLQAKTIRLQTLSDITARLLSLSGEERKEDDTSPSEEKSEL
mmetsp:Transcript_28749/g.46556  ORF Transcript_28749/g.46556 Transcript_28749/m.46556 type:complete len:465 (+) Transcript_28749:111-1505(+)